MGVKAIRMWQATDGSTHPTESAARTYDAAQVRLKALREVLSEAGQNIPLGIFNSHKLTTELRDVCNQILDFNRRYRTAKTIANPKP